MSTTTSTQESKPKRNPIEAVTKSSFLSEFKEFINRGSVVDLAIGVAVGGAFTAIVKSLVDDIIMPVSSLIAGGLDFSTLAIDVPNIFGADSVAHIAYGNFIQNVINFLLVAFVIFIVVKAMNKLNRVKDQEAKILAEKKAHADKVRSDKAAQAQADQTEATKDQTKAIKAQTKALKDQSK